MLSTSGLLAGPPSLLRQPATLRHGTRVCGNLRRGATTQPRLCIGSSFMRPAQRLHLPHVCSFGTISEELFPKATTGGGVARQQSAWCPGRPEHRAQGLKPWHQGHLESSCSLSGRARLLEERCHINSVEDQDLTARVRPQQQKAQSQS